MVAFRVATAWEWVKRQRLVSSTLNKISPFCKTKIVKRINSKYYNHIWVGLDLQDVSSFEHFHHGHFLTRTAMLFLKQLVLHQRWSEDDKVFALITSVINVAEMLEPLFILKFFVGFLTSTCAFYFKSTLALRSQIHAGEICSIHLHLILHPYRFVFTPSLEILGYYMGHTKVFQ